MEPTISTQSERSGILDFFINACMFGVFYVAFVNFFVITFRLIDTLFPPVAGYYAASLSFSLATLIVLTPVLFAMLWYAQKKSDAQTEHSKFRKVFMYLTIIVSAAVVVGNIITVLYFYLDGQNITAGFLLKSFTLIVGLSLALGYYVSEARYVMTKQKRMVYGGVVGVLVIGLILTSFGVVGSPRDQRLMRHDSDRVNHLSQLQSNIVSYWQQKGSLPATLEQTRDPLYNQTVPVDPETGFAYEYRIVSPLSFELCASFARESNKNTSYAREYYAYGDSETWSHGSGRTCFTRTIDPDIYPIRKPMAL